MENMVIRVVEFLSGRKEKFKIFLSKNKHTQGKFLNFENWCSGKLSKVGHHFDNTQCYQKFSKT